MQTLFPYLTYTVNLALFSSVAALWFSDYSAAQVITVVLANISVLWVMMSCRLVCTYQST
jgi:hypothetical protein